MAKKKQTNGLNYHIVAVVLGVFLVGVFVSFQFITQAANTRVPGHQKDRYDEDGNGYPDTHAEVNGHYTSLYAYDNGGNWYWDLGDGRMQGTVESVAELDQTTVTNCEYVVNYRGGFNNDPFMDSGWIQNHINCQGYDDNGKYNYDIVHKSDPRYRGNPDWALWGDWEYHVLTESKSGNLVRPDKVIQN